MAVLEGSDRNHVALEARRCGDSVIAATRKREDQFGTRSDRRRFLRDRSGAAARCVAVVVQRHEALLRRGAVRIDCGIRDGYTSVEALLVSDEGEQQVAGANVDREEVAQRIGLAE